MPVRFYAHALRSLTIVVAVFALAGCAQHRAAMTLDQPHAPPSQRQLTLASDWAFSATQDARRLILIDFALPGASDGPRDFRVFLAMPGNSDKAVIAATSQGGSAAGFFIQKVGRLSGKTTFVEGSVSVEDALLQPGTRELTLDVRCADGTRIAGSARLRESDEELRLFLQSHAADVAALDAAESTQTAYASDATPGRTGQPSPQSDAAPPPADSQPAIAGEASAVTK